MCSYYNEKQNDVLKTLLFNILKMWTLSMNVALRKVVILQK